MGGVVLGGSCLGASCLYVIIQTISKTNNISKFNKFFVTDA